MNSLKHFLLICLSLFIVDFLYGQSPPCFQDSFCTYRLCDTCAVPFPNTAQDKNINYGKYNLAPNYPGDVKYKNENDNCKNDTLINYAECRTDSTGKLRYDVYYPVGHNYTDCPLPAVIYVHGGGFSDCSPMGGNSDVGIAFAQRGFVFFNIEYRAGRRLSSNGAYNSVQQELATYRASQDVRGAVRSIIKRQREQFALPLPQRKPYQIDTNYLFIGGNSAGSITALNVAYYPRQSMVDSVAPHSGSVTISQALGPINADYYYGTPDIEYTSKLKGIFDQWGAVFVPPNFDSSTAKNFFDLRIPTICFHGQADPVVPIGNEPITFAPISPGGYKDSANVERTCLIASPFRTEGNISTIDYYSYGSNAFYDYILQPLNIPSEEYVDCLMKHAG